MNTHLIGLTTFLIGISLLIGTFGYVLYLPSTLTVTQPAFVTGRESTIENFSFMPIGNYQTIAIHSETEFTEIILQMNYPTIYINDNRGTYTVIDETTNTKYTFTPIKSSPYILIIVVVAIILLTAGLMVQELNKKEEKIFLF